MFSFYRWKEQLVGVRFAQAPLGQEALRTAKAFVLRKE